MKPVKYGSLFLLAPWLFFITTQPVTAQQLLFPDSATLVMPGLVTTKNAEVKITFNHAGTKMLWGGIDWIAGKKDPDIWESEQINDQWTAPKPVSFNSDSSDFDPFFAPDDSGVYFFSNRPGGFGGDDLYFVSYDRKTGRFGTPRNLGPAVNSKGDEWAPVTDDTGTWLYFASDGHGGLGKHDLFKIEISKLNTTKPENLGNSVNSADEDFDAALLPDGTLVFTSDREDHQTGQLYYYPNKHPAAVIRLPDGQINNPGAWTFGPSVSRTAPGYLYFSGHLQDKHIGRTDIYKISYHINP